MDEIDLLKEYKKFLRIILLIALATVFFLYLVAESHFQIHEFKKHCRLFFFNTAIFVILIYIVIYIILVIKYKYNNNINELHIRDINREIPSTYSPAICSVLINNKLEAYKDYTATILYLESKKYLKLDFSTDEYNIIVLNNNLENLNEHETYVFNCVNKKDTFDIDRFKKAVTEDMLKQKLITTSKNYSIKIVSILFLISYILLHRSTSINQPLLTCFSAILLLGTLVYFLITYKTVKTKFENILSKKGQKLAKEIIKFKNFIKEYTLLSKRDIQYKELAGIYLAYAISLGETHIIDKFLQQNEQYRNFIYYKQKIEN